LQIFSNRKKLPGQGSTGSKTFAMSLFRLFSDVINNVSSRDVVLFAVLTFS
jgi:hypothetical protein